MSARHDVIVLSSKENISLRKEQRVEFFGLQKVNRSDG
jgi:hypothetical protein